MKRNLRHLKHKKAKMQVASKKSQENKVMSLKMKIVMSMKKKIDNASS